MSSEIVHLVSGNTLAAFPEPADARAALAVHIAAHATEGETLTLIEFDADGIAVNSWLPRDLFPISSTG